MNRNTNRKELSEIEHTRLRKLFDEVPLAHLLGLKLDRAERGTATLYMDVRRELTQNDGLLHGGALASLIDTAAAFAALTLLEENEKSATIDLNVQYLRPVTVGKVRARATVLRAGRRTISLSVEVTDDSESVVAVALTSTLR